MIDFLHRFLQIAGIASLLVCLQLAWGASPYGGEGWQRARLLYAGAGMISALTLVAIGGLGVAVSRSRRQVEAMQAQLIRLEALLEAQRRPPVG